MTDVKEFINLGRFLMKIQEKTVSSENYLNLCLDFH